MAIKRTFSFKDKAPILYLVATPIGNLKELSPRAIETLQASDLIACEDSRVASKLLHLFNIEKPLFVYEKHREQTASIELVNKLKEGKIISYISDAGYPLVSDPGSLLVERAIENDIPVSVINGPSALLSALVPSGLKMDHFYFEGFLAPKSNERIKRLEELKDIDATLIFYEAPHRIDKTLIDLAKVFGNRHAVIARELTKIHEEYIRGTLDELADLDPSTLIGEMVIIVEGKKKEEISFSEEEIVALLKEELEAGKTSKEAIANVVEKTKQKKNLIYRIYTSNF